MRFYWRSKGIGVIGMEPVGVMIVSTLRFYFLDIVESVRRLDLFVQVFTSI